LTEIQSVLIHKFLEKNEAISVIPIR